MELNETQAERCGSSGGAAPAAQTREKTAESQRARLLVALASVVDSSGMRGATIARVAEHAGVSRTTVTDQFESLDGCFLALLDSMLAEAVRRVTDAFEREDSWTGGVVAGLEALLLFLDEDPVRARVCLLERAAVPPAELGQRAQTLERLGLILDARVRKELPPERQPPLATSEATVLSVLGLLRRRLLNGDAPPFAALLGQLTGVVLTPYLDPGVAAEFERRANQRACALLQQHQAGSAPCETRLPSLLRHAKAHRLRACVRYLAENPGASNRGVGNGLNISHAGQVSTLLSRLREAGLAEKEPGGPGRPNSWSLSPFGAEMAHVLERW
jgi:AcrR family transcriptional regulator